jgi:hypothetical protein
VTVLKICGVFFKQIYFDLVIRMKTTFGHLTRPRCVVGVRWIHASFIGRDSI